MAVALENKNCYLGESNYQTETFSTNGVIVMAQTALKYDLEVREKGRIELSVPFSPGVRLTVFVIEEPADTFDDLIFASQSSLDFWDNPYDDEDWNNAWARRYSPHPIPFTDLSSNKRRPVIVVSNNDYNRKTADIVAVGMTSNPKMTDYTFTITSADLNQGKLNRPGQVRVDKIYTLSRSIVVKTFGRVNTNVPDQIQSKLHELTTKKP